jgi:uncharacterized protein YaaR (DUF327 family)
MRIDKAVQGRKTTGSKSERKKKSSGIFASLFGDEVKVDEPPAKVDIQEVLGEIDDLGHELLKNPGLLTLERYKTRIRGLLQEYSRAGFRFMSVIGEGGGEKHKQLIISQEVDKVLVQLTDAVMSQEGTRLKENKKDRFSRIATSVESIKGILIDLVK